MTIGPTLPAAPLWYEAGHLTQVDFFHQAHCVHQSSIAAADLRLVAFQPDLVHELAIEVTDVQCKFKLSQNRPLEDQKHVFELLSQSSDQNEVEVSRLMSEAIRPKL